MNSAHLRGAASELKAQMWFIENGYQVFTPVIQQSIADFVVLKDGVYKSVQVKTAYINRAEGRDYLQIRLGRSGRDGRHGTMRDYNPDNPEDHFDILFTVYKDEMWLCPKAELPVGKKTIYYHVPGVKTKVKYNPELWRVQ